MANEFTALYVAYSIVWIGVFAYLIYMHVRQKAIEKDIRNLREEVSKHGE